MLAGQFILTGPEMPTARVVLLNIHGIQTLRDTERLAAKYGWKPEQWLPSVFHEPASYAFRCTDAMLNFLTSDDAADLNVPHRDAVRGLAALLALGEPIPGDRDGKPGDGGHKAALVPVPDTRPPTGGTAAPIPDALRF